MVHDMQREEKVQCVSCSGICVSCAGVSVQRVSCSGICVSCAGVSVQRVSCSGICVQVCHQRTDCILASSSTPLIHVNCLRKLHGLLLA